MPIEVELPEHDKEAFTHDLTLKFSRLIHSFVNSHKLTKEAFLIQALDAAFDLIPEAEKGSLYIAQDGIFKPVCAKGYDMTLLSQLAFTMDNIFIGFECVEVDAIESYQNYIQKREDHMFDEKTLDIFKALGTYGKFTSLYAPLQFDQTVIGFISLENFQMRSFSKISQEVLKFYAQSISNYYALKLREDREKRLYDETIMALVTSIEVMDSYTEGHARRVTQYSEWIATALQVPYDEIEKIKIAGLLHDVGKIGISTSILNKPSRLTPEEYEIVKRHPADAKRILEHISDFGDIVTLAYMHHEHYDGGGYPEGLSGDAIPLGAHILQVADAFDAMTSERAYRSAMTHHEALTILQSESGKQFHPLVVDVATAIFSQMGLE